MTSKHSKVLNEVLEKISISEEKNQIMEEKLNLFLKNIDKRIKKLKYEVDVFVGGSFAKKTLIKKNTYDIDIYFRFNKKYSDAELTKLTNRILRRTSNKSKVHGSRDYFQVKINSWLYFEIIPVCSVNKVEDAKNITDLSYSHVKYVNKKMNSLKILNGIKLAKAFCYANRTYGAESYVKGFSGYSLELLVYYYGGFLELLKGVSKSKDKKIIIDIEKSYKNKKQILLDLNGAKLESPIVLIDPTFKRRNALAALSEETFEVFKKSAKKFLESPSTKAFEKEKIDFLKINQEALKKKQEFILINIKTKKQEGDIAGTKLLKFFNHLGFEFSNYFEIIKKEFEYSGNQEGIGYFVLEKKREILMRGPSPDDKKHSLAFREKYHEAFILKDRLYAKKDVEFNSLEFLKNWMKIKKKKMKEMYISKLKIIN